MTTLLETELIKMSQKKERSINLPSIVGVALILADVLAVVVAQFVSSWLTPLIQALLFGDTYSGIYTGQFHSNLFLLLGAMVSAVFYSKGFYTARIPWWSQVQYMAKVIASGLVVQGFLSFALKLPEPRIFMVLCWGGSFLLMIAFKIVIFKMAALLKSWKIPTVIISEATTSEDLLYAFASDISTGYSVTNIFIRSPDDSVDLDINNLSIDKQKLKICYGQEDHNEFIQSHPDNFYIISLDTFRDTAREGIIRILNDNNVTYAIVPTLSRVNLYQMQPVYFFGHDVVMLSIRNSDSDVLRRMVAKTTKRAMDIVVSGLALLAISPILLTLTICLKVEGQGGSIFYGGRRIGKNGKFFSCWKIRSMEPDSDHLLTAYLEENPDLKVDWEKYRKLPRDPRVTTRTARFIRKASLDELPQIWNIFVGDMSLVGPRPILEDEVSYFEGDTLQEYLSVRPGLTGLWQVSGRNKTSFKRRVYWDSWYVRNWSFWGDIVILIKTPIVLLTRKGAS